ncbi:MAG: GHKL domain-containing protein [Lachnospiraceae bacterium]|nr:GHKL domain-containing protein [Lachnospiraceae bacterium]
MEQVVVLFIGFLFCGLDVGMLCVFFQSMFERKHSSSFFGCACVITTGIIFGVNSFQNSMLNFVILPLIMWIFAVTMWKLSLRKAFIYIVIFYIVFVCEKEMAFEMVYRLLASVLPDFSINFATIRGMGILFMEYVVSFLLLLFFRNYMVRMDNREDSSIDWYLLIMPFTSVLILFSFVFMDFPESRVIQVLMCVGAFLLYFSNAIIFVILAHYAQIVNESKIAEMSLLKRDMERSNFETIEKNNQLYRKYMHDVHRYFSQFRSLVLRGEGDKVVHIIDEWEDGLTREEKSSLYTESPVLNSILEEYESRAAMKNIEMNLFVEEGIRVEFIRDTDKISLFGNLLENAIEAAAKAETEHRLDARLYMGNPYMLIFQIKNTWNGQLKKTGEGFQSVKQDAEHHGLGIGIVREIAEKYRGSVEFEEQGKWFVTTLMISNCTEE